MLNELCDRWVDWIDEFWFEEKIVEFNELYVCLRLGLSVVREKLIQMRLVYIISMGIILVLEKYMLYINFCCKNMKIFL